MLRVRVRAWRHAAPHAAHVGGVGDQVRRVYNATWSTGAGTQQVVVKVVNKEQGAHEKSILSALAHNPRAHAIRLLGEVRVGDTDVGLITPACPRQLFVGATAPQVERQAIQLCKVSSAPPARLLLRVSHVHDSRDLLCVCVCVRAPGVFDVQAIGEWHKTRVLHLDIKPANIAVDSHGDVVVLDAGVSRFADEGTADVRTPLGTPGYIAPELRHAGTATATTASDVYSLGVTLRSAIDKWATAASPDQVRAVLPVSCCCYH